MSAERIVRVTGTAFEFPTPYPEADGTLEWSATTAVTVEVSAGGHVGLGWTYSSPAAVGVVTSHLAPALVGRDARDITGAWWAMERAGRNLGVGGLYQQAVSAADMACWDLKAKLLGVPLSTLLGQCRAGVPIYGSGGFVNQTEDQFSEQVQWWREHGCRAMKIKIGRDWSDDWRRVQLLRELAGEGVELMVDANGAYALGQARRHGEQLAASGVTWFEEPVSSDDLEGLRVLRAVLDCDVAAGEYVSRSFDAARLLPVVDCLQLDATRCGGFTGFLACAALAEAANREISAHCAPALHAQVAVAVPHLRNLEWFADHAALEPLLVDGCPEPREGSLAPANDGPGHGMTLSRSAARYRVS